MITVLIVLAIISVTIIGGYFFIITDFGKWFYHDTLKWHKPDDIESFDGCSLHSKCKFCGKEIMQDSQGNWF